MSFGVDYHSNSHHSNQHIISSFFENIIDGNHNVSKQLFKAVIPYTIFFQKKRVKEQCGLILLFFYHVTRYMHIYSSKEEDIYVKGYECPLTQLGICCGI